jgi:hypothetical protein
MQDNCCIIIITLFILLITMKTKEYYYDGIEYSFQKYIDPNNLNLRPIVSKEKRQNYRLKNI